MDQGAEPVAPQDRGGRAHGARKLMSIWQSLARCPVRSVRIEVIDVVCAEISSMQIKRHVDSTEDAVEAESFAELALLLERVQTRCRIFVALPEKSQLTASGRVLAPHRSTRR
jgi:hypothetical protein